MCNLWLLNLIFLSKKVTGRKVVSYSHEISNITYFIRYELYTHTWHSSLLTEHLWRLNSGCEHIKAVEYISAVMACRTSHVHATLYKCQSSKWRLLQTYLIIINAGEYVGEGGGNKLFYSWKFFLSNSMCHSLFFFQK